MPASYKTKISPEVREVLERCEITSHTLKIPGRIDRKLYEAVNKVLVAAGGKWKKQHMAHVFPSDPREILGVALKTGAIVDERKVRQAFFTPPELAARVVQIAQVSGMDVLEPSAGHGALVRECLAQDADVVLCYEIDQPSCDLLEKIRGCRVARKDFLEVQPFGFDRIVMNPPFAKGQADAHVMHAMKFLKPGGRLVAIMPMNSSIGIQLISRSWGGERCLRAAAVFHDVEPGAFRGSGTMVQTKILEVRL